MVQVDERYELAYSLPMPIKIGSAPESPGEEKAWENWAEFNRRKWKCKVEIKKFKLSGSEAYCEALFFLNRKGQLILPPMNYYHLVRFRPSDAGDPIGASKEWMRLAELMLAEMSKIGCPVDFVLPPGILDVRPWEWRNFITNVNYTYLMEFPYKEAEVDGSVRRRVNKAAAEGFVVRMADDIADVHACLTRTEERKGFSHDLTVADLEMARDLLGDAVFRPYICYGKDGVPASACIVLVLSKERAMAWAMGTDKAFLSLGVSQQVYDHIFKDLSGIGVGGLDFAGANTPSVAEAKSQWGAELVPYYTVRKRGFKDFLRECKSWFDSLTMFGSIVGFGSFGEVVVL